jgi:FlaG/FlaF family flagellin (archaellin)
MSNGNGNSSSSVGIVAIVAILILAAVGAWFMYGRTNRNQATPKQTTAPAPSSDIEVKVNLPDSVTIK